MFFHSELGGEANLEGELTFINVTQADSVRVRNAANASLKKIEKEESNKPKVPC